MYKFDIHEHINNFKKSPKKVERNAHLKTLMYKYLMILSKKNIWLLPNRICIVRGNAVALNLMFENKKSHKLFLQMWDKYLGHMTEVINYHLTPTDWTILFKTKSNEAIIQAYQNQRQKSQKARHHCTLDDPKRMISEHIRIFLSQYVRQTNKLNGRKGTLVLERFQKYILNKRVDYQKIFKFITNQTRIPEQQNTRYRADEKRYDPLKEVSSNGLLRVGNKIYSGVCKVEEGYLKCMRLVRPNDPVLRNFLQISKNSKFTQNSS